MIKHYLTIAYRNLWKYKIQNLIGILGLAVGFSCFVLVGYSFTILNFGYNRGIPNALNTYHLQFEREISMEEVQNTFPEIEKIIPDPLLSGLNVSVNFNIKDKDIPYYVYLSIADTAFVDFFSLDFLYGNKESAKRTANGVVFFESELKKRNISPKDIIGKELQVKDGNSYMVTGVIKDFPGTNDFNGYWGFVFSHFGEFQQNHYYVSLHNNDEKAFRKKIDSYTKTAKNKIAVFEPLAVDWSKDKEGKYTYLIAFLLGSLILISALFNYISFHVSLFLNRLKECAIRKVNGGNPIHLFFLFYTEIAIGFILACILSIAIISPVTEFLNSWIRQDLFLLKDLWSMIFRYGLIGLFFAALLCILPTVFISRSDVRTVIFGLNVTGGNMKGQNVLLFFQLLILMFFLYTSIFFGLMNANQRPVFDRDNYIYNHALIIETESKDMTLHNNLLRELNEHTQIRKVFLSSSMNINMLFQTNITLNDSIQAITTINHVSSGMFEFFDISLLEGELREFDEGESAIVNKAFANMYLKDSDALGSIIKYGDKYYRIFGIVDNSPFVDLKQTNNEIPAYYPVVYFPISDYYSRCIYVLPNPNIDIRTILQDILKSYIPEENGYTITTLKENMRDFLETTVYLFSSSVLLFIISLIIGLLSIYSAITMNTEKRRREVAIRKINGARIKDIIKLFGKKYFILWTTVWLIGCPIIFVVINIEEIGIPLNIWSCSYIMLIVYLSVLALIILTIIFQILKVARINPAETLKTN